MKLLVFLALLKVANTVRVQEGPRCKAQDLLVPNYATPSGDGKIWEYYHFLVDFAPRTLYALQRMDLSSAHNSTRVIHAPGWYSSGKFQLEATDVGSRSMKAHFASIFKAFGSLEIRLYRGRDAIKSLKQSCSPSQTIPWASDSIEWWSMQPQVYFSEFQRYMWAQTDGTSLPLSVAALASTGIKTDAPDGYVLMVKRATPPDDYVGPWTGTQRRRLPDSFWEAVVEQLRAQQVAFLVVELETVPLADQVTLFKGAHVVATVHGAGFSNILFCRPGTLVLELGSVDHPCYSNLAEKMGLLYRHHNLESGEALAQVVSQEAALHQLQQLQQQQSAVRVHGVGDVDVVEQ